MATRVPHARSSEEESAAPNLYDTSTSTMDSANTQPSSRGSGKMHGFFPKSRPHSNNDSYSNPSSLAYSVKNAQENPARAISDAVATWTSEPVESPNRLVAGSTASTPASPSFTSSRLYSQALRERRQQIQKSRARRGEKKQHHRSSDSGQNTFQWDYQQQDELGVSENPSNESNLMYTDQETYGPISRKAQSEPGGPTLPTQQQQRFEAYINRFATFDPRMDHRENVGSIPEGDEKILSGSVHSRSTQSSGRNSGTRNGRHGRGRPSEGETHRQRANRAQSTSPSRSRMMKQVNQSRTSRSKSPASSRYQTWDIAATPSFQPVTSPRSDDEQFIRTAISDDVSSRRRGRSPLNSRQLQHDSHVATRSRSSSRTRDIAARFQYDLPPTTPADWEISHRHSHSQEYQTGYMDRVEIETPEPARVTDLKEKLWDPNENLQVAVRPSMKEDVQPQRLGYSTSHSRSQVEPRFFKSRFYEAAQRGIVTPSAPREESEIRASHSEDKTARASEESLPQAQSSKSIADLVARINAVERANPAAALVQIDAILKAESETEDSSSHRGRGRSPARRILERAETQRAQLEERLVKTEEFKVDQDNDGDSSCDDTTVSSITNPTYQSSNKNPTHVETAFSSRHRRPSALDSYGGANYTKLGEAAVERRKNRLAPPSTIRLSTDKGNADTEREIPEDGIFEGIQSIDAGPMYDPRNTSSEDVSDKIKRLDGVSSPDSNHRHDSDSRSRSNASADLGSLAPSPTPAPAVSALPTSNTRRQHPWDSSLPVRMGRVDTQDTSMERGNGVETRFSPKYQGYHEDDDNDIESYRAMRKERLARENERGLQSHSKTGDLELKSVSERHPSKSVTRWEETRRMTKQQHENARTMSEDFDSAWVAVPTSSFFSQEQDYQDRDMMRLERPSPEPEYSRRTSMSSQAQPDRRPEPQERRGRSPVRQYHGQPELSQEAELSYSQQYDASFSSSVRRQQEEYENLDGAGRGFGTVPVMPENGFGDLRPPPSSPSSRTSNNGVEVALVVDTPPASTPRRGIRALLNKHRSRSKSKERRRKHQETVVLPPGSTRSSVMASRSILDGEEKESPRNGTSRSPSRERGRSIEESRSRNPKIAKKFSRLLRVYDQDKEESEV